MRLLLAVAAIALLAPGAANAQDHVNEAPQTSRAEARGALHILAAYMAAPFQNKKPFTKIRKLRRRGAHAFSAAMTVRARGAAFKVRVRVQELPDDWMYRARRLKTL